MLKLEIEKEVRDKYMKKEQQEEEEERRVIRDKNMKKQQELIDFLKNIKMLFK